MKSYSLGLVALMISIFLINCSKDINTLPGEDIKLDTPGPGAGNHSFTVDGKWKATIDGQPVTGTIDTSFLDFRYDDSGTDTIISCFGSSDDKKFNIEFIVSRSRFSRNTLSGKSKEPYSSFASLVIDTLSKFGWRADFNSDKGLMNFTIDSLNSSQIKMQFEGTLDGGLDYHTIHTVTNGSMSCAFYQGNGQANSLSMRIGEINLGGIQKEASLISNTLIIEGIQTADTVEFLGYGQYRMLIHTGGTIQPGVYKSSEGKAAFTFIQSTVKDFYADDSLGHFNVVIDKVENNIVQGYFQGKNNNNDPVSGHFRSLVKNYQPEADADHRWTFSETYPFYRLHNMYGGNMTTTSQRFENGQYYITLNGESDHGQSSFSIDLHSSQPIAPGTYVTASHSQATMILDSMVFRSVYKKPFDQTDIRFTLFAHPSYFGDYPTAYCIIESMENHVIRGTLHGELYRYESENSTSYTNIKQARFTAAY